MRVEGLKQIKGTYVIATALGLALTISSYFIWTYLHQMSPNIVAGIMPSQGPQWIATIYGEGNVFLSEPRKVCVHNNQIYVSDTGNHRVVVFDYNGRYLRKFGDTGNEKTRLSFPHGIAIVKDEIFVADPGLDKVAVFDLTGKFKRFFGQGIVVKPADIAYHKGRLYFADPVRQQVVVLDLSGKKVLTFGQFGTGPGDLAYPNSLTVTSDDRILVSDTNNSRIQVFDLRGKFLTSWAGDLANHKGYFSAPQGIAVDKENNAYVADPFCRRIDILKPDGILYSSVQQVGPAESNDTLRLPVGTWIDENQRLYVADYGVSRVVIYDLK